MPPTKNLPKQTPVKAQVKANQSAPVVGGKRVGKNAAATDSTDKPNYKEIKWDTIREGLPKDVSSPMKFEMPVNMEYPEVMYFKMKALFPDLGVTAEMRAEMRAERAEAERQAERRLYVSSGALVADAGKSTRVRKAIVLKKKHHGDFLRKTTKAQHRAKMQQRCEAQTAYQHHAAGECSPTAMAGLSRMTFRPPAYDCEESYRGEDPYGIRAPDYQDDTDIKRILTTSADAYSRRRNLDEDSLALSLSRASAASDGFSSGSASVTSTGGGGGGLDASSGGLDAGSSGFDASSSGGGFGGSTASSRRSIGRRTKPGTGRVSASPTVRMHYVKYNGLFGDNSWR
jgi:hypothetical protein